MKTMKIAVPITDKSEIDILNKAFLINSSKADMVEWRVDFYEDVQNANKVLETLQNLRDIVTNKQIIFTLRTKYQGGNIEVSQDYYMELNTRVSNSKYVDYIDIEMQYLDKIENIEVQIIGSYHNFNETPSRDEILSIFKDMESKKADILKIALMPNTAKDVLILLDATYDMYRGTDRPIISISMGELGKISRISGGLFGSSLTFASLGKGSAPGQMSLEELSLAMELLY